MKPTAYFFPRWLTPFVRLQLLGCCALLGGCMGPKESPALRTLTRLSEADAVGAREPRLAASREFLQEMLVEAKVQRGRRIVIGTQQSNVAVLADLEQRCRDLLARKEPLRVEQANALQATLDALAGRRRGHWVSTSGPSPTTDDTTSTTTCEDKDKGKDKDMKCKDHDHDRKKDKDKDEDCDDRKR